jgi:hypothetical protein
LFGDDLLHALFDIVHAALRGKLSSEIRVRAFYQVCTCKNPRTDSCCVTRDMRPSPPTAYRAIVSLPRLAGSARDAYNKHFAHLPRRGY